LPTLLIGVANRLTGFFRGAEPDPSMTAYGSHGRPASGTVSGDRDSAEGGNSSGRAGSLYFPHNPASCERRCFGVVALGFNAVVSVGIESGHLSIAEMEL
jgi:hypothetical protein